MNYNSYNHAKRYAISGIATPLLSHLTMFGNISWILDVQFATSLVFTSLFTIVSKNDEIEPDESTYSVPIISQKYVK